MDNGAALMVSTDAATQFEGITGVQDLAPSGNLVAVDGALQADGSVHATRVTVRDAQSVDAQSGPLLFGGSGNIELIQTLQQGQDFYTAYWNYQAGAGAVFALSAEPANLSALPFTPSFTAETMLTGQNVYVTSPAYQLLASNITAATTVTLLPQTVAGDVTAVGTSGSFTVYTVSLPNYDPFVIFTTFAVQGGAQGQPVLAQPGTIYVYADSSTQMLNASAPAVGDSLRFYGLLFNDGGNVRMDCARIMDGVQSISVPLMAGD